MEVQILKYDNGINWDHLVHNSHEGTLYHLLAWRKIIEKTYAHKTYYLISIKSNKLKNSIDSKKTNESAKGILPLVHLQNPIFGNHLVSMPFFDHGGILAEDQETESKLLREAIRLSENLKAKMIEIRQSRPLKVFHSNCFTDSEGNNSYLVDDLLGKTDRPSRSIEKKIEVDHSSCKWQVQSQKHKLRMLLDLPDSSEELMKSFKSKLRSQIKKPIKENLVSKTGGIELLEDFFKVFTVNMRDLGSPVHSEQLFKNILKAFNDNSRIVMVYKENIAVAGGFVLGFKETLANLWASSLRKYSALSPNMLLYWAMLEYACEHGYSQFDFGRSSPGEGTYNFKKQWGAKPQPLHWYYISREGKSLETAVSEKSAFKLAAQVWKNLPVSVTRIIGPRIRKYIGL